MKIATYDGKGIVGGLPTLLRRVGEEQPYIVSFQKLKNERRELSSNGAWTGRLWSHLQRAEKLEWRGYPSATA